MLHLVSQNCLRKHLFFCYVVSKVQCIRPTIRSYCPDTEDISVIEPAKSVIDHPVVIAHRGACGYMPEHTLASYALGVLMGADNIEPDLIITKDHQIIARHENDLGLTTDIAQRSEFASRRKSKNINGISIRGWFAEDFTLEEIKTLRAIERMPEIRPGNVRFNGIFAVPTLQEIIDLAKGLQISQKRAIGLFSEIKHSTYFRDNGFPIDQIVLDIFHKNGYVGPNAPVIIQSFEISNLQELKRLTDLRLVQLYDLALERPFDKIQRGSKLTYEDMATPQGLREVARYAYGVSVELSYIIPRNEDNSLGRVTSFVQDAHAVGLKVFAYTFRAENYFLPTEYLGGNRLPTNIGHYSDFLQVYCATGMDGFFCDHPDMIRL